MSKRPTLKEINLDLLAALRRALPLVENGPYVGCPSVSAQMRDAIAKAESK